MARRETPAEAWERMRNGGGGGSRPMPPAMHDTNGSGQAMRVAEPPPPQTPAPEPPPRADLGRTSAEPEDLSVGDLVKQLSEQTSTLVKQEMRLAQSELKEKGKKAGIGAGFFGAGGLVAFFGLGVLITAAVIGLATVLAAWLSALIVGVALLAGAGIAALMGKKQIEQATPPAPEQAMDSIKRDVDTVKTRFRR